jgi:hypothetical protein
MRRARRADANQKAIVEALRTAGRSVAVISDVGRGVPDLIVGVRSRTFLLEVKAAGAALTPDEDAWHRQWRGHVAIVRTPQEAIEATG